MQSILTGTIAALAMTATAATAQDWTVDIYGGITPESTEMFNEYEELMEQGTVVGAAIFYNVLIEGVSLGLDIMRTSAELTEFPGDFAQTTSAMAVARYSVPVSPDVAIYGTAGLGFVRNGLDEEGRREFDEVGGGQLAAGARYGINDAVTAFAEVKYLTTFEDALLVDTGVDLAHKSTSILIGASFGF